MDGYVELSLEKLANKEGINELNRMLNQLYENTAGDGSTVRIFKGYGSPENVIAAGVGAIYQRLDGGANTTIYAKESGTGATGWSAL